MLTEKNLLEIESEILLDYTGDFELIGSMLIGELEQKTNIRFRNVDDFEGYINAIDVDYDSEDVIFTGWLHKLNTPQFNIVIRSGFGRGVDCRHHIVEYKGNNSYIPSSGFCFMKCFNFLTGKNYEQDFLEFIRNEDRRSNMMTSARIHAFRKKYKLNIRYYDNTRVYPRGITERNKALYLYKNHFCLIWKSDRVSFNKAIEEMKANSKFFDNNISDIHVKSFIKYEYKPKTLKSQLTNMIVYDLETCNRDRAVPFCKCVYTLFKISRKYDEDITPSQYQNCLDHCIVFKGTNCINQFLDCALSFKGEVKRVDNKIVENELYMIAHIGSGFDSYVILNNLPQWRRIVDLFKNGAGIFSKFLMGMRTKREKYLNTFILDVVEFILIIVYVILVKAISYNPVY